MDSLFILILYLSSYLGVPWVVTSLGLRCYLERSELYLSHIDTNEMENQIYLPVLFKGTLNFITVQTYK